MQTKVMSAVESATNIIVGYFIAVAAQIFVFPIFGLIVDLATNLKIGAIFTLIAFVRSYALRRAFEHFR